jgi:hypothetical protein
MCGSIFKSVLLGRERLLGGLTLAGYVAYLLGFQVFMIRGWKT